MTRYTIHTKIAKIEELSENLRGHKDKDGKTVIETINRGWFILMEGSREWLSIGTEKPDVSVGDKVRITISKVPK